tara:strand:- start:291 stop:482 length:192 start_codon:yes stop_codon:yes gene_type:complete
MLNNVKEFKLPISFKKYCKFWLVNLTKEYGWKHIYNKCVKFYGIEIVNQSIKELEEEGRISKI